MYPYQVTQINDHIWQIAEVYHLPAALPIYLIVGTKRAALIDTAMGLESLRQTVEEITDLPVTVLNTHVHIDHAAGNHLFDCVCMHPLEKPAAQGEFPVSHRLEFIELKCMYDAEAEKVLHYAREHMPEYRNDYPIVPIQDGELIDLGGVVLEAIHTPGHTKGSMVYISRSDRVAFCGDTANPRSSIAMFPGAPTVQTYVESLQRMLDLTTEVEYYYGGHRLYAFTRDDIKDILQCAKEIVDGDMGEPYPMIVSKRGPVWGRIHWCNGKRITFQPENVK